MHRTVNKLARLSLTLLPVVALQCATAKSYQTVDEMVETLSSRTHALERQVARLNRKLAQAKHHTTRTHVRVVKHTVPSIEKTVKPHADKSKFHADALPNHLQQEAIEEPAKGVGLSAILPEAMRIGTMPVLGSPYFGVRTQFDGGDLIVNTSRINKDLALLQLHQHMVDALHAEGQVMPDHPVIELSGSLSAALFKRHDYSGSHKTDLDLTGANIDVFAVVNPWVNAFMQLEYDNAVLTPTRVANSRVRLNTGFVVIGDLNRTPFYGSVGQLYMPFGQYSTHLESTPLVRSLGRILNRGVVLGFNHRQNRASVNGSVFTFRGDTKVGGAHKAAEYIYEFGANLQGAVHGEHISYGGGLSFVSGIAESFGNQGNAFGTTFTTENFEHRVPAVDARGFWGYDGFKLYAEAVKATRSFSLLDLSYNGHGARPEAYYLEASYSQDVYGKPASIAATIGKTKESYGLRLPQRRYAVSASYAPLRDTVVSLEFRHDRQYSKSTTSAVQGVGLLATAGTLGNTQNTLTAQLDVYF